MTASLLETEARYWRKEVTKRGRKWWNQRKEGIRKNRGEDGLNELLNEMTRQRDEERNKK